MMCRKRLPPADHSRMHYALKRLHRLVVINTTKGSIEMSNPTPDMRSIDQNDINAWAENVNAAVTALQTIIANGNLTAADESLMNTAIGTLDGVAGTVTPPVTPPAGQ